MRDIAYTERTIRRNTKHIKNRHRHGLCNIPREKPEGKRSLKNEICHSSSMGIRIRRKGNAVTASWSDRGIGRPVQQYAY